MYKRLPGRGVRVYRQSLWLASDHVLNVINRGYSEDYKRFYFRDVRAIQIRRTGLYRRLNLTLGAVLLFCLTIQVLANVAWRWDEVAQLLFAGCTTIAALSFLVNFLLGPSCEVHLYTAVHTERLSSLVRTRTAQKAVAMLRARIEGAQGLLTQEEVMRVTGAAP